jgi:hypothetical protein
MENNALRNNIMEVWVKEVPPAILATVGSARVEAFLDEMVELWEENQYRIPNFNTWSYDNFTRIVRQRWGFRINKWG